MKRHSEPGRISVSATCVAYLMRPLVDDENSDPKQWEAAVRPAPAAGSVDRSLVAALGVVLEAREPAPVKGKGARLRPRRWHCRGRAPRLP